MALADYYDYLDIDCADCGKKFYVNPENYRNRENEIPTLCGKCRVVRRKFEESE